MYDIYFQHFVRKHERDTQTYPREETTGFWQIPTTT